MEYTKDISIVVALLNEEESLPELISWIVSVMDREKFTYEIVMVDDGSTDASWSVIKKLSEVMLLLRSLQRLRRLLQLLLRQWPRLRWLNRR